MGYHRAGFTVFGVDIQKRDEYPFHCHEGDAIGFIKEHGHEFDAIHASPPCQRYSQATRQHGTSDEHPDLIGPTREALLATGKPYVMENVPHAPLIDPITLCGSMFGSARLRRHRLFEASFDLRQMKCDHSIQRDCITVAGNPGGSSRRDGAERFGGVAVWREVMGIDWMTGRELAQAIPPAYTEWIGRRLIEHLGATT